MTTHPEESKPELEADVNDPQMIAMVASGLILIGGFCVIAFVSGPLGLFLTLLSLALLCLFYAIKGDK